MLGLGLEKLQGYQSIRGLWFRPAHAQSTINWSKWNLFTTWPTWVILCDHIWHRLWQTTRTHTTRCRRRRRRRRSQRRGWSEVTAEKTIHKGFVVWVNNQPVIALNAHPSKSSKLHAKLQRCSFLIPTHHPCKFIPHERDERVDRVMDHIHRIKRKLLILLGVNSDGWANNKATAKPHDKWEVRKRKDDMRHSDQQPNELSVHILDILLDPLWIYLRWGWVSISIITWHWSSAATDVPEIVHHSGHEARTNTKYKMYSISTLARFFLYTSTCWLADARFQAKISRTHRPSCQPWWLRDSRIGIGHASYLDIPWHTLTYLDISHFRLETRHLVKKTRGSGSVQCSGSPSFCPWSSCQQRKHNSAKCPWKHPSGCQGSIDSCNPQTASPQLQRAVVSRPCHSLHLS